LKSITPSIYKENCEGVYLCGRKGAAQQSTQVLCVYEYRSVQMYVLRSCAAQPLLSGLRFSSPLCYFAAAMLSGAIAGHPARREEKEGTVNTHHRAGFVAGRKNVQRGKEEQQYTPISSSLSLFPRRRGGVVLARSSFVQQTQEGGRRDREGKQASGEASHG
jgi:hypothetical protein